MPVIQMPLCYTMDNSPLNQILIDPYLLKACDTALNFCEFIILIQALISEFYVPPSPKKIFWLSKFIYSGNSMLIFCKFQTIQSLFICLKFLHLLKYKKSCLSTQQTSGIDFINWFTPYKDLLALYGKFLKSFWWRKES